MKWNRMLAAGCALLMAASTGACAPKEEAAPAPEAAKGRYVETELELPENTVAVFGAWERDGAPELVTLALDSPEDYSSGNYQLLRYENGAFTGQNPPWLEAIRSLEFGASDVVPGPDGRVLVLGADYSGDAPKGKVLRENDAGALEEIALSDDSVAGQKLAVTGDGSFLVAGAAKAGLFGPDGALTASWDEYTNGAAAGGDSAAMLPIDGSHAVRLVSPADGAELESIPYQEGTSYETALCAGGDGSYYLANDAGIFRAAPGMEEAAQVLDGSFYQMASSSLSIMRLLRLSDGRFWLFCSGDSGLRLLEYAWDAEAPAGAEKTLRVASLYDNTTAREAAVHLQMQLPGLHVQLEPVFAGSVANETGGELSDAVRTINTALLAGDGADVYILDDLPLESYLEKGVLMDLSELAQPHLDAGEWLPNVAGAFARDGKLSAIPARFGLPVLWAPDGVAEGVTTFPALADYAEANPQPPLFRAMHPKNILERFYPVCSPLWRDGSGAIDEAAFAQYLTDAGRIAASAPGAEYDEMGRGMDGSSEIPGFYTGKNQVIAQELKSTTMLPVSLTALAGEDKSGTGSVRALPGQTSDVFIPRAIVGVNSRTALPDEAKRYVEAMLSEQVQAVDGNDYIGLPVNAKTLEAQLADLQRTYEDGTAMRAMGVGYTGDDGEMILLRVDVPLDDVTKQTILDLCHAAKTASLPDPVLLGMITEETAGFFEGTLTAEQAAAAVTARTQAYLQE